MKTKIYDSYYDFLSRETNEVAMADIKRYAEEEIGHTELEV